MFTAIDNLVSVNARPEAAPWDFSATIPDDVHTKSEFRRWLSRPTTRHLLVSGIEGTNSALRASMDPNDGNHPHSMGAFIVDYDAPASPDAPDIIRQIFDETPELVPQWIVATASGNRRLVWVFEVRLGLGGAPLVLLPTLIKVLAKHLRIKDLLAGLDDAPLKNPTTFFEVGVEWNQINPDPVPTATLRRFFAEAAVRAGTGSSSKAPHGAPEIPMDKVLGELERKFPGRWPNGLPFEEGCRGPAVWDPTASNPTSCIYTKHGVYRFSSDKGFHSYAEILGKDFVRRFEQDSLEQAVGGHVYYAGKAGYYRKFPDDTWVNQGKEDVALWLISRGLNKRPAIPGTNSPVEEALLLVQHHYRVDGAIPLPYIHGSTNGDPVRLGGKRFLNSATVKPIQPAPVPQGRQRWGEGFEWMASWLRGLFTPRAQLIRFLHWWKVAYEGALDGHMTPGLALFLVGGVASGKTLLNTKVIGASLGGGADASSFLVDSSAFNKNLLEVAHWHIDDARATSSWAGLRRYTENLKAAVANQEVKYQPKYVDEQLIPRHGTICVTLNDNPDSLAMLPELDRDMRDKLLILKCADTDEQTGHRCHDGFQFPSRRDTESCIRAELPFLLRFLLDWEPPATLAASARARFGSTPWINPDIEARALRTGYHSDIYDVLQVLWRSSDALLSAGNEDLGAGVWVGSASELAAIIAAHPVAKSLLDKCSARSVGRKLTAAAKIPNSGVEVLDFGAERNDHSHRYVIAQDPEVAERWAKSAKDVGQLKKALK
jgi:hypothetical protein